MIKTVTHRNGTNVNKQLVSTFNEEIKRLNAEDYNYTKINTAFLQLEAYLKQLAARLNIEINISWNVSANGRVRLQLADNSQRYNIELRDLNQMFNGNFNAFADFILQVETVYKTAANDFAQIQSAYNSDIGAYADELSNLTNEYSELLEDAKEADLTPEDITNIITEADDTTKGEVSQIEQTIEESLPTPPEGTIGSGVTTGGKSTDELISDAQRIAEEAAQQAQERAEAEAGAKAAQEEADRAQAAADRAEAKAAEAREDYDQAASYLQAAKDDLAEADKATERAGDLLQGATIATGMAGAGTLPTNPGQSNAVTIGNNTTVVTMNADGSYTMTTSVTGHEPVTHNYDADAFNATEGSSSKAALEALDEVRNAEIYQAAAKDVLEEAQKDADAAKSNYDSKSQEAQQAQAAANAAQAKADAAQQAADDANIPYATDDELENGWYNDDAEPEDTTEGNDDWGDWDGPSWGDGSVEL